MKRLLFILGLILCAISCEKKIPDDLEMTKKELIERQDKIYNKAGHAITNAERMNIIGELQQLQQDVISYSKDAAKRGFPKNNDNVVEQHQIVINKLKSQMTSERDYKSYNSGYNQSEQTSIQAYRQGYRDGRDIYRRKQSLQQYGVDASTEPINIEDEYISRGYNYSQADFYVYKSGYEDAILGKPSEY